MKNFKIKKDSSKGNCSLNKQQNEKGFSLVEVIIAMVIMMIVLLGVYTTFTYAVSYNAGNKSRSEALAILQQEVEQLRSKKFTPQITDTDLVGGTKSPKTVTLTNGNRFTVQVKVDDDPSTPNSVQVDSTKTIKEITVTVTVQNPTPGWQTAVPATVVLRRARAN
jgi:prepilin-type N-terminal cleavage/methylation domain-containing protein